MFQKSNRKLIENLLLLMLYFFYSHLPFNDVIIHEYIKQIPACPTLILIFIIKTTNRNQMHYYLFKYLIKNYSFRNLHLAIWNLKKNPYEINCNKKYRIIPNENMAMIFVKINLPLIWLKQMLRMWSILKFFEIRN